MRSLIIARLLFACSVPVIALVIPQAVNAADWLVLPSQYTHDPATGLRISQYAPTPTPTAPLASDFRSSGYTHVRSSLNFGQSADNYHRVQQWGPPVQPYGEWRFPNRPYSAPYSQWGAPFAGLGTNVLGGFGFGGSGVGGFGYSGGYQPGLPPGGDIGRPTIPGRPQSGGATLDPYPVGPSSAYPDAPYFDGYHPVYRD